MKWEGNKPGTLERVSDERLADLARDRTGWEQSFGSDSMRPMSGVESLSIVDETRAWRRHKLTDVEKLALRDLADSADPDVHRLAIAAIDRIVPRKDAP